MHVRELLSKYRGAVLITIYCIAVVSLIFLHPLYGDPAIVYWVGKVTLETGFAYDPVCTKSVNILCVRAPLFYYLLAGIGHYYKVLLATIFIAFIASQWYLAKSLGYGLKVTGLMLPQIYLLFSRTYVDMLTVLLSTILLFTLIRKDESILVRASLFIIPSLMVLTRESAIVFPLFLILLAVLRYKPYYRLAILFSGYLVGMLILYAYLLVSGGSFYSDFNPHIPSLHETYKAFITATSPILPWEIGANDIMSYLWFVRLTPTFADSLLLITRALIHLVAILYLIPIWLTVARIKRFDKPVKALFMFGFFTCFGLLFLKGDVDFFRHISYMLPLMPHLFVVGMEKLRQSNRYLYFFASFSITILFILYFARTVRLYQSGYSFDACEYIRKRPSISELTFFYKTACQ